MIRSSAVLPPGVEVKTMGAREYSYLSPGMREPIRVTTDADYYEQHADSVELWSTGSPLFPMVEIAADMSSSPSDSYPSDMSVRELLAESRSVTATK